MKHKNKWLTIQNAGPTADEPEERKAVRDALKDMKAERTELEKRRGDESEESRYSKG